MHSRIAFIASLAAGLVAAAPALADHNSKNGAGWARMPNDIHNMRVDTRGVDNDAFREFVRHGNGADSVNRFPIRESGNGKSDRGGRTERAAKGRRGGG